MIANRVVSTILGIVATAAVGVALFAVYAIVIRGPQAPLKYTQKEYQAERAVYAPGETLVYTATLTVKRVGALTLTRGYRISAPGTKADFGRARLCNGTNAPVISEMVPPFPEGSLGVNVEGKVSVPVYDMPPGSYWLVSSVGKADSGESLTQVALTITKPCGRVR